MNPPQLHRRAAGVRFESRSSASTFFLFLPSYLFAILFSASRHFTPLRRRPSLTPRRESQTGRSTHSSNRHSILKMNKRKKKNDFNRSHLPAPLSQLSSSPASASTSRPRFPSPPRATGDIDPDNASILVAGGGGVALSVARRLKDAGAWVWMLQRSDVRRPEIEKMMAVVVRGDATSKEDVDKAFGQIEDVDLVVSTIGGTPADPRADSEGNINLIEAAAAKVSFFFFFFFL